MKSFFKNAFLIIALSLAILMIIGICLYDFIPTNSSFAEANIYEADSKTLKILAEITNDGNLNEDGEATNGGVVLKEYTVTEADLAMYAAKRDYQKGKPDPFSGVGGTEEGNNNSGNSNGNQSNSGNNNSNTNKNNNNTVTQGSSNASNSGNSNNSSSNGNQNNNGTTSDGTLLNSKGSK